MDFAKSASDSRLLELEQKIEEVTVDGNRTHQLNSSKLMMTQGNALYTEVLANGWFCLLNYFYKMNTHRMKLV